MRKYELEQDRMNAVLSAIHEPKLDIYMPDVDMESVGSLPGKLHDYGREHRDQDKKRLPQVETTGIPDDGGFSDQTIIILPQSS